jgi:hypothetical protein
MTDPTYTDDDLAEAEAELAEVDEPVAIDEPDTDADEAPDEALLEKEEP